MKRTEIEDAIEREVAQWPDCSVEFEIKSKGRHPVAKLSFAGAYPPLLMRVTFSGTPSDVRAVVKTLGDVRRSLRQMGAQRASEASKAQDEEEAARVYRKPNEGKAKRPDPVEREPIKSGPTIAEQIEGQAPVNDLEAVLAENRAAAKAKPPAPTPPAIKAFAEQLFADPGSFAFVDGEEAEPDEEAEAARREALRAAAEAIEDGIYFGLAEEVYHAVPRLSTSGLQKLLISPATFWQNSWLNPGKVDLDEEETKAQILGKAYHCARLEPERFEAAYCRKIDKADFPKKGTVWNGTEIGNALADLGQTKKMAQESVIDQGQRLEECGFEGAIWPLEEARWKAGVGKRIPLPAKHWDEIALDVKRIRESAEIAELLSGGEAEVSIFWTDRYGIRMKARADYLTPAWWDDFKTFANPHGKELEQALADAVRYNRYHVQAVTYRDAIEAIRAGNLKIMGEASDDQHKLIAAIRLHPGELACWYIFQEKGGIPNLLARQFEFFDVPADHIMWEGGASEAQIEAAHDAVRSMSALHIRGLRDVDLAKRLFVLYSQTYPIAGTPWAPINARGAFDSERFSRYWLEGAG